MTGFTALVLAGSRGGPRDPVAEAAGVSHKALAEVGGAPMLARVCRALAQAGATRIGVCIERPEVLEQMPQLKALGACRVELVSAAASPSLSVKTGAEQLGTPLLVTTGDHALLKPEWVRDFLERRPPDADIVAAVARAEAVMAAQPDGKRTFLRFSDGRFSGCNLFYLATPAALGAVAAWRRFEAHRKDPLALARMLGPGALISYAAGTLSMAAALKQLGRLAGAKVGLVEMPDGEAAVDVDKPSDLELARRIAGG